jgi:16S rRNA (adenine1518-N6/adenine1519-N6)-dimethyltransferase
MLTTAALKTLLKSHDLRLTKRRGQHHLIDEAIIERIVSRCALSAQDLVIEIGPGLGALTEPLALRARRVIAVEIDRGICALLTQRLRDLIRSGRLEIRCQDVLEFSWQELTEAVVVGAIPYHVTSPILVTLCEARAAVRRAILVVQRDVARRLLAAPGTKAYGRLSLLVQYGWQVSRLLEVPRRAFFPQPRVDSTCVELLRRDPAIPVANERALFAIVRAAFAQRRKTLANCLAAEPALRLSRREAEGLIERLGMPPSVRGEALSLAQFASLANLTTV